jgi:hypothetical protein
MVWREHDFRQHVSEGANRFPTDDVGAELQGRLDCRGQAGNDWQTAELVAIAIPRMMANVPGHCRFAERLPIFHPADFWTIIRLRARHTQE